MKANRLTITTKQQSPKPQSGPQRIKCRHAEMNLDHGFNSPKINTYGR
jgi:hypothetical protein